MLNVKTLTDTMSRMELPQLQQYAALHKNDPYIVTLALSIANQKKQMQAAKAGQGVMPQSTVVDRDIMGIPLEPEPRGAVPPQPQAMPEDVGIGQLPAQNMQRMAEGGIVAFDKGGDVPSFAGPAGSYVGTANAVPEGAVIIGNMYKDPKTGEMRYLPGQEPKRTGYEGMTLGDFFTKAKDAVVDSFNNPSQYVTPAELRRKEIERQNLLAAEQNKLTAQNYAPRLTDEQQFASDVAKRNQLVDPSATTVNTPGAGPTIPAAVVPPGTNTRGVSDTSPRLSNPALPNPVLPPSAGLPSLNVTPMTAAEAMAAGNQFGTGADLTASVDRLRADALKTNQDLSSAYKEGLAALPKPGAEAEERLKAREAQDAIAQADAKGLAIFKAGLGMLAGTSPHAFENIGKGALVGLEDYAASIKEFRKLGMERDKAYADIEAARNAAARDDFKTSMSLQEKAADRLAKVDEKGIDVTATLFKTNKETASTIYRDSFDQAQQNARTMATEAGATGRTIMQEQGHNARTLMQERGANARTQAQLAAPPAEARMAMMLGSGNTAAEKLESGLRKMQDLQSDKTGKVYAELYAKHIEESRKNMTEPLSPTEFAASMRGILSAMSPKVITSPGANAPVYNRP